MINLCGLFALTTQRVGISEGGDLGILARHVLNFCQYQCLNHIIKVMRGFMASPEPASQADPARGQILLLESAPGIPSLTRMSTSHAVAASEERTPAFLVTKR